MSYEPVPRNNTVHRRTGTFGKFMNTVAPLKHEPNRKERLMKAINDKNEVEAIRLIRDTGMTGSDLDKDSFIHYAIMTKQIRVLEALIAAGANVNIKVFAPASGNYMEADTPLYRATIDGFTEAVHALLTAGAELEPQHTSGDTPLMVAASKGNIDIVQELIAAGANVNALNSAGGWGGPLHYAAGRGYTRIIQVLIAAGANVNLADKVGNTPLMIAVDNGWYEIVQELIAAGADVNLGNGTNTPLFTAIRRRFSNIVRILIAAGAHDDRVTERVSSVFTEGIREINKNIPITDRNFNLAHAEDPVSLEEIKEGNEYYTMNENVNPYSEETMKRLLKDRNPKSPTTRKPIKTIRRHKRPVSTAVGGRRKRTRKYTKPKRKTRHSKNRRM